MWGGENGSPWPDIRPLTWGKYSDASWYCVFMASVCMMMTCITLLLWTMRPAMQLSLRLVQGQLHLTIAFSIYPSDERRDLVYIDFHITPSTSLARVFVLIDCSRSLRWSLLPADDGVAAKTLNFLYFPSQNSIFTLSGWGYLRR